MGCGSSALAHLLAVTSDKFVREIYGLELAFSADGALPYLSTLPTIDGLDAIFFALDSAGARLGVVDGHASPSAGTSLIRSDGRVRLDEVHSAYKAGKTLLLTHLQNSHLGTARIARSIECDLHAAGLLLRKEVGANLFLTPPNSRGFDPHYDGHDVLILQLGGTKVWKAFEQLSEIPAGMEGGRLQPDQLSEQCKTFELTPGNVLYLPRGRPHVAYTNSENSLHLTLSIIPLTMPAIAALTAGNLLPVAKTYRALYPERDIYIAGDDDRPRETELAGQGRPKVNVGRMKAEEAATAIGAQAVFPSFPAKTQGTDWNDLEQVLGRPQAAGALQQAIAIGRREQAAQGLDALRDDAELKQDRSPHRSAGRSFGKIGPTLGREPAAARELEHDQGR